MNDKHAPPEYLTPTEAAHLLRVHVKSVWWWILRGQIEHVRQHDGEENQYLIPQHAVIERVEGQAANRQPALERRLRQRLSRQRQRQQQQQRQRQKPALQPIHVNGKVNGYDVDADE